MALVDMQRWTEPGTRKYVQTIQSSTLPGWMVYRGSQCIHRRATEDEVEAWLTDNGYTRQPITGGRVDAGPEG